MLSNSERDQIEQEFASALAARANPKSLVTFIFKAEANSILLDLPAGAPAMEIASFVIDACLQSRWTLNPSLLEMLLEYLVDVRGVGALDHVLSRVRQHIDQAEWDFFVSYAQSDQAWAEWVAWQLEEDGYRVLIQAWDFVPGSNWILSVHEGVQRAARTLAILSSDYLSSVYRSAEWEAAWTRDPAGEESKLLVVRVADCDWPGLLTGVVGVDLFGLSESVARSRLRSLIRASIGRSKPLAPPEFPSAPEFPPVRDLSEPAFPGSLPKVWNVPARNPDFTGQLEVLARIRAAWTSGGTVVIQALQGMGGIGKTMTAVEYAHRNAADYDVVWWVNAEERYVLASQLAALAGPLGLPPMADVAGSLQAVRSELRSRHRWLLIFDNATAVDDVVDLLPDGPGHVLITTRRGGFSSIGTVSQLDVLDRVDAIAFLRRRIPDISMDQADALAAQLGYLPLALAQAASYIDTSAIPPAEYLELFRVRSSELLARGLTPGQTSTVATTWSVSIEALRQFQPAAVELLELCAWLAPEPISLDLFTNQPDRLPEHLAAVAADPLAMADTVRALVDYSLVRRTANGLVLHRLVQDTIRHSLSPSSDRFALVIALLRAGLPRKVAGAPENWPLWRQLLPHVLAATARYDECGTAPGDVAWLLEGAAAYITVVDGRPIDGSLLLKRARKIVEAAYGDNDPQVVSILRNLGEVMAGLGRGGEAQPLLERALAIHERHPRGLGVKRRCQIEGSFPGAARQLPRRRGCGS